MQNEDLSTSEVAKRAQAYTVQVVCLGGTALKWERVDLQRCLLVLADSDQVSYHLAHRSIATVPRSLHAANRIDAERKTASLGPILPGVKIPGG
jgi:hypothetical protein